nr:Hpt domain-containing protein [Pseudomonas flavescens]
MEDEYPVLLDTFVADSDERLRLLQEAERLQDAQAMRHAAHSFKGSCSNMGAKVLAESCRELEELARRGDLTDSAELIGRVEREFAIVRILLKSERQRFSTD